MKGIDTMKDKLEKYDNENFVFFHYMNMFCNLGEEPTEENFVYLQKRQADLLEEYKTGDFTPEEYKVLSAVADLMRNKIREYLRS